MFDIFKPKCEKCGKKHAVDKILIGHDYYCYICVFCQRESLANDTVVVNLLDLEIENLEKLLKIKELKRRIKQEDDADETL